MSEFKRNLKGLKN